MSTSHTPARAETVDNARLIAAAPELLAALIAFRDAGKGFAGWHPKYERAIELAQSAIAAAAPPE